MDKKMFLRKTFFQVLLGFSPLLFSICTLLFMIVISMKGLWFCVKILDESQVFFVFAAIAFCAIFLCLWVGILVMVIFSLRQILYLAKIKTDFNENCLRFTPPEQDTISISKEQIDISWKTPAKLTILLEYQGRKFTFGFLRNLYSRSVLKEMETLMRTWGKFTEDRVLVRQKVRGNSLNSLSMKNNFITILQKIERQK